RSCRFSKIVALDSQSDGKSSLLEALLGFRFNVREIEMGTRRPLILQIWFITVLHLSLVVAFRCLSTKVTSLFVHLHPFSVLTEIDRCYCVLVNALDGAAFPSEKDTNDSSSSNKVPLRVDTNSMKTKNSKLTLFSGFVSYQMVRDAYDAGSSGFGSLLSMGHSSGKKDRLYMKGPGGRGEVEVVVSGVVGLVISLTSRGLLNC
ncbi:hypothetical protein E1A91_D12G200900v1, partial [Gossypium mustelinum]